MAREYRRSILIYNTARLYDLPGLEILARMYIEQFGETLSVFDMLRATRDVFSKLPKDEAWLPSYIKRNLQQTFMSDRSIFKRDEIYSVLGEDRDFDKAIMRIIVDIYSTDLQLLENKCVTKEPPTKACAAEACAAEEWRAYAHPVPKRLVLDVNLYDDWTNPSSKKRAKREKILKEKCLPIPD